MNTDHSVLPGSVEQLALVSPPQLFWPNSQLPSTRQPP